MEINLNQKKITKLVVFSLFLFFLVTFLSSNPALALNESAVNSSSNQSWGLVPCNLGSNNPDTSWNETDPCEFMHLIVMLGLILDFLLWKMIPLIVFSMIVVSGILFYVSIGDPTIPMKLKAIWRSIGKGLIIIFFAWTFINIIMISTGYTYGQWWNIF